MKTSLFDFHLPAERIATHPLSPRDASRLLVIDKNEMLDRKVRNLPDLLRPDDLLVFNDTRVLPARLVGKRGDATIAITLHKAIGEKRWLVYARPGKKLREGDTILFSSELSATVNQKHEYGEIDLSFICNDLMECLHKQGQMPLPPYMKRQGNAADLQSYQTVYAQRDGAVAAPTAGLHFSSEILKELDNNGIERVFITLHVGAGTFKPVKTEDTDNHVMHSEYFEISEAVADTVNSAREAGRRIVAIGTTTLRALESAADPNGSIKAAMGETSIFITPGYRFKAVDALMTNFHLPKSTLFMLVSSFMGLERMRQAYRHAIDREYRFYSYGDACLLIK